MKKRVRSLILMMVFVLSLLMTVGCSRVELDAEKAVDAFLKAELKGEIEEYAEMVNNEEEEIQKEYDATVEGMVYMFAGGVEVNEELAAGFTAAVKDLLASVKYEIKGSEKGEDGNYAVTVTIYPSDAFILYVDKMMEISGSVEEGKLSEALLQNLKNAIESQSFGEGEDIIVNINYDKDEKVYEFDKDDTAKLMKSLYKTKE